ncbi:MAG: hypothetical protein DMG92_07180 [Acidobacteria bacterium]|nr:MAG: hypothetical protein DMG92_07180 [Acidobacteriota bacterium]
MWELFRVCYRSTKSPFLVGGLVLFAGYAWAALCRLKRPVLPELMHFHRREQMQKLRGILLALLKRQKIDSFRVATDRELSEQCNSSIGKS